MRAVPWCASAAAPWCAARRATTGSMEEVYASPSDVHSHIHARVNKGIGRLTPTLHPTPPQRGKPAGRDRMAGEGPRVAGGQCGRHTMPLPLCRYHATPGRDNSTTCCSKRAHHHSLPYNNAAWVPLPSNASKTQPKPRTADADTPSPSPRSHTKSHRQPASASQKDSTTPQVYRASSTLSKRPPPSSDMQVTPLLASPSPTPAQHHHHNGHHLLGRARRFQFLLFNIVLAVFLLVCMYTHDLRDQVGDTRPSYVAQALQSAGVRQSKVAELFGAMPTMTSATDGSDAAAPSRTLNTKRGTLFYPSSASSTALVTTTQQVEDEAALDALELTSNMPPSFCITDEDIADAPKHHIFVAAPLFNSVEYVDEFLESIESQNYPHVTVVIYDDASDDGSADLVASLIPSLSFETILLRGDERHGPSYAKWVLMRAIRRLAAPMDLVLFMDGDDKFFHVEVLDEVAATFRNEKPWFAYGRIRGYYEEQCGPPPPIVYHTQNQSSSVRTSAWTYCHPRVFRAFLLDHFEEEDFRDPASERWLLKYTDRQMVYKALELSGDEKVAFMDGERPHVYYRMTGNSTVYLDKVIKDTDLKYVQALVAQTAALPEPIHIISCAYKRVSLLKQVLTANIEMQDVGGRPVYLHVCNNGDDAQAAEIESILESMKGLAGYRLRTFHDNPGGFARFYMMQDAVQEFPVDHFVMLDDDIQLPAPNGLRDLLAEARPQEYNSWWGRHFKGPMADYHSSRLTPPDLKAGKISGVTKFHYAGTGLSVIDADIIRFYFPLLDKVPEAYRKVEDLWLSYVVHQIGWRVRRIVMSGVNFMEDINLNKDDASTGLVQATALWRQLKPTKLEMLEDLRVCGWNV